MNQLELGAFSELNEQEMYDIEGGCGWVIVPVVLGVLAAGGVAIVAQSVGNYNRQVNAQNQANETGKPVSYEQLTIWGKSDGNAYVANPQPDYISQMRW